LTSFAWSLDGSLKFVVCLIGKIFFESFTNLILNRMPYLILDLEMSGQEAGYHDIIQIGALLADNDWKVLSKFETLVYPDNEETFSSYSEKVHGISLEDLEDALPRTMLWRILRLGFVRHFAAIVMSVCMM
jgi:DNA polymerase III epsilon subunit-like protein